MKPLWIAVSVAALLSGSVIVDRIAVITGKHVIKASDIERDLRLTSFINQQPLNLSPAARRDAAARLVDQEIIRRELTAQGYARASDDEVKALRNQMVQDRFQGSSAQFAAALQRYGVNEQELHDHLLWQLTVLRFINDRFRHGVLVTDEDVKAYYDQHLTAIRKESPADYSLAAVSERIKTILTGQRVDQEFEAWLAESRKQNRIEYREAAFQ